MATKPKDAERHQINIRVTAETIDLLAKCQQLLTEGMRRQIGPGYLASLAPRVTQGATINMALAALQSRLGDEVA
jgi:hypothetical protein